jgi:hypothetical protein
MHRSSATESGGKKDSGSMSEFSTVLIISVPIFEKCSLKT